MGLQCFQSDDSRYNHQQTDKSQILFQPWCHLYTRKTTGDREQCPMAHQTKQVSIEIFHHWPQPFVAYFKEINQSIPKYFHLCMVRMEFAFQKLMRRGVKYLLEVQYECIYLTSCSQNFSPIIYNCDQLHSYGSSWKHVACLIEVCFLQDEP